MSTSSDLEKRAARRKKRIQTHLARDFAEAERWDLEFWQRQSPEDRLSALVAIRRDVEKVEASRRRDEDHESSSDGDRSGL